MKDLIDMTKALSDPNRIRALMVLTGGELCVCQIIEMLGLAPSTVSKHMSILRQAGLVQTRKEARWIYYRLTDRSNRMAHEITCWIAKYLKNDRQVSDDTKHLKRIQKLSKEQLGQCYRT